MKKKSFLLVTVFTLLLCQSYSQQGHLYYPFNGFHIGITGQPDFIQPATFISATEDDLAPKAKSTVGWDIGIEFSYHFAKYFGVSAGINLGAVISYKYAPYFVTIPDGYDGRNEYGTTRKLYEDIVFPIKFEFHYPLHQNLFFTTEVGAKFSGIYNSLGYYDEHSRSIEVNKTPYYYDKGLNKNSGKFACDLLLGLGLYYKLPYSDLLRFTAGVNISFKNSIEGYYEYKLTNSYGTFAVRNNYVYTQIAYIHTFNFEKAKRTIRKNQSILPEGVSYSDKRERNRYILNLLKQ